MGIQAAAHIGLRVAGPRFGLAMSGFAAGFVSSVAAIAAMGARCRASPALRAASVAGALCSNIATLVLLWVVAATVAPAHLAALAPVLASGTLAALVVGALALTAQRAVPRDEPPGRRAFEIRQAVAFAVLLSVASAALAYLNAYAGPGALLGATALAGFFDVHAASASALALLAGGSASAQDATLAMLLAVTSNMISKAVAAMAGGWRFAIRVNGSLALVLLAAWLPFWLR
jgi:uncharacterized membrane protein (DUF4010 family)